ncbi:Glutathione S-transferase, C-terminal-like [Pseudocohnilembus persalinus]|uniref:Glutathione S-transferase, C-terminal-like n=1 Tax=Pseudocohnilembus persalinus TaxID=266149 RepID=A0A0V0R2S4_PSEPJ|nr:Glutathione S-transferase, C-terminal-like [Pseudocohnilembus persalinus]|eukprot:KRX08828.1 Glutathione S-transferase, C-terminal-like [Pseudocohnilembus persalinus]
MGNQFSTSYDIDPLILKVSSDTVPYSFEEYQIEIIKLAIMEKGLEFQEQKFSIKDLIQDEDMNSNNIKLPRLEIGNFKCFTDINNILQAIDDQYSDKKIFLIPANYKERELMQGLIKQMLYFIDIQDFQNVGQLRNKKHKREFMVNRIKKIIKRLKQGQKLLQNQANEEIQVSFQNLQQNGEMNENDQNNENSEFKLSNQKDKNEQLQQYQVEKTSKENQQSPNVSRLNKLKNLLKLNSDPNFLKEEEIFNNSYIENNEILFNQMTNYELKNFAQAYHNPIMQLQEKIKEYEMLLNKIQEWEYIYLKNEENCIKILENLEKLLQQKIKGSNSQVQQNGQQIEQNFYNNNIQEQGQNIDLNSQIINHDDDNNNNQQQNQGNEYKSEDKNDIQQFYLIGDNYTMADVVGSVFIKLLKNLQMADKLEEFKLINSYYEQMKQREAFKQLISKHKNQVIKNKLKWSSISICVLGIIFAGILNYYYRDRNWMGIIDNKMNKFNY